MPGREILPDEGTIFDFADSGEIHNRLLTAQVFDVDGRNGTVKIRFAGMASNATATAPVLWASFPENGRAAWGRFMPQERDIVKVGFDYGDVPQIVGFDLTAPKQGKNTPDLRSGWSQIADLQEAYVGNVNVDAKFAKLTQFVPLNPGEFDFMSSGGAYIYGTNNGKLYLAGGSVSVALVNEDFRISARALLLSHTAEYSTFKFGQVRRADATGIESTLLSDPTGSLKEFGVWVKQSIGTGVSLDLATVQAGNVIDSLGVTEMSSYGVADIRVLFRSFTAAGVKAAEMSIDKNGNWEVSAPLAPKGAKFSFPLGDWNSEFKSTTHKSTVTHTVNSPLIYLGSAAAHPLILSTIYRGAESAMHTTMVSQLGLWAILNGTAGASLIAAAVPMLALPIVGPMIASPMIAAAGVAIAASVANISAIVIAINAFELPIPASTYLSKNVFTK